MASKIINLHRQSLLRVRGLLSVVANRCLVESTIAGHNTLAARTHPSSIPALPKGACFAHTSMSVLKLIVSGCSPAFFKA